MNRLRWAMFGLLIVGCSDAPPESRNVTLATTTSTRDSGLLDALLPMFESQTGFQVKVVAVGSGQALELGRRGDADVLLKHAPEAEETFMADGFGVDRRYVMENDFVLVGPPSDTAGVTKERLAVGAFIVLRHSQIPFISRGDESAAAMKEFELWDMACGGPPQHFVAGGGMAEVLRMASEKKAYTLSDRGTFLALRAGLELEILFQGDPLLRNPYSVIVVGSKDRPPTDAARRFADFLLSPEARQTISQFGIQQFGEPLFFVDLAKP